LAEGEGKSEILWLWGNKEYGQKSDKMVKQNKYKWRVGRWNSKKSQ
jgi:hypothetical protein